MFNFFKPKEQNHGTLYLLEGVDRGSSEHMNAIDDEIRETPNLELLEDNRDWVEDQIYWNEELPDVEAHEPYHPAVVGELIGRSLSGQ